jgi:hypothetical protein
MFSTPGVFLACLGVFLAALCYLASLKAYFAFAALISNVITCFGDFFAALCFLAVYQHTSLSQLDTEFSVNLGSWPYHVHLHCQEISQQDFTGLLGRNIAQTLFP